MRAKRRACPFTHAQGKSPLPQRFCAEPMYPYQPLPAGGTKRARGAVPLAKRKEEPEGGGSGRKLCRCEWDYTSRLRAAALSGASMKAYTQVMNITTAVNS